MEWKKAIQKNYGFYNTTYEIPNRWLQIHFYEAFNILFRIENSLRVFVYMVLKNEYLDKWTETQLQISDSEQTTIGSIAKKRMNQAQDFGYLGYEISSPLMHLNSGELIRIITSEQYWKHFARYFKGRKEIIRNKLEEIGSIRNSLAHFRPIKEDDVEVLKQNAKHALIAVELCLSEMISMHSVVPTNTEDEWYKKITTLGNQSCVISLHQSASTEWLRIQITYKSNTFDVSRYGDDFLSYHILNLKTPNIIPLCPAITKYVTYVIEEVPYTTMPEDFKPNFQKKVSMVFSKKLLINNLSEIIHSLETMLDTISKEEELVTSDHLARGELIEPMTISARYIKEEQQPRWDLYTYQMIQPFKENHPAEYWGDLGLYQRDFIAGTTKYPWMPSEVARFDI